jgi:hypothetical protein
LKERKYFFAPRINFIYVAIANTAGQSSAVFAIMWVALNCARLYPVKLIRRLSAAHLSFRADPIRMV